MQSMKRTFPFSLVLTLLCIPAGLAILVCGEFTIVLRIVGLTFILALMGMVAPKTLYLPVAAAVWSLASVLLSIN